MTEPPAGPPGPPTQDPAANLAAFQSTDDESDISVPGLVVVHPDLIEACPRDVDLPAEVREYADPSADLRLGFTSKLFGKIIYNNDGVHAEGQMDISVDEWFLAAMAVLLIGLAISASCAVVLNITTPGSTTALIFSAAAVLCAFGLIGVVIHRCRRWWHQNRRR